MRFKLYLLAFLILLLSAFGITPHYFVNKLDAQSITPKTSPKATSQIQQLDILMGEHAIIGAQMMIARYSLHPSYQASRNAVNKNSDALKEMVKVFYSETEADKFSNIWNKHIDSLIKYTDALRTNNQTRKNEALKELQRFSADVSDLLARGDKELFITAQDYFAQHVLFEKGILDEYKDKDYAKMYQLMHDAYEHASTITSQIR